jgi:hypothetical protein
MPLTIPNNHSLTRNPQHTHEFCLFYPPPPHTHTQALALVQVVMPLTTSIQALLSVKDLRSPLLLRAMLRPAVVLIAPLLQGSVLAGAGVIGQPVTAAGQVYAIVVGCIVSVGAGGGGGLMGWGVRGWEREGGNPAGVRHCRLSCGVWEEGAWEVRGGRGRVHCCRAVCWQARVLLGGL